MTHSASTGKTAGSAFSTAPNAPSGPISMPQIAPSPHSAWSDWNLVALQVADVENAASELVNEQVTLAVEGEPARLVEALDEHAPIRAVPLRLRADLLLALPKIASLLACVRVDPEHPPASRVGDEEHPGFVVDPTRPGASSTVAGESFAAELSARARVITLTATGSDGSSPSAGISLTIE